MAHVEAIVLPPLPVSYQVERLGWWTLEYPASARDRVRPLVENANAWKAQLAADFGQDVLDAAHRGARRAYVGGHDDARPAGARRLAVRSGRDVLVAPPRAPLHDGARASPGNPEAASCPERSILPYSKWRIKPGFRPWATTIRSLNVGKPGQLELNVMMPMMAYSAIEATQIARARHDSCGLAVSKASSHAKAASKNFENTSQVATALDTQARL